MQLTTPIEDLSIPPTVQALLAARLDRLPARDKMVLQTAAVIGRTFSPRVLRHVLAHPPDREPHWEALSDEEVDVALAALEKAEFLRRHGEDGDTEYAFKHPLTQAVAYGSQLGDTRAQFHLAVARALQVIQKDRLGQCAELVAHHFAAADWKYEAIKWRRRAALLVTNIEVARSRRS